MYYLCGNAHYSETKNSIKSLDFLPVFSLYSISLLLP